MKNQMTNLRLAFDKAIQLQQERIDQQAYALEIQRQEIQVLERELESVRINGKKDSNETI